MPRFKGIIFDLDDTLYAERDYVLGGFREVARWAEQNLEVPAEEGFAWLARAFAQGIRGDTFNRWLATLGVEGPRAAEMVERMVWVYRRHRPVLNLFPGADELLASLRGRTRLGLISDGYLDVQRAKLAALGLLDRLDCIILSDQWGRQAWKPNARPFREALNRLELGAGDVVYVADNPLKDFSGARECGMATVWSRHCGGDYACLTPPSPEFAADVAFDDFEQLRAYLLVDLETGEPISSAGAEGL